MYETMNIYDTLRSATSAALANLAEPDPQPEFDIKIGWFDNYDGLFRGVQVEATDIAALAEAANNTGRATRRAWRWR
jgi:hypothetical protein